MPFQSENSDPQQRAFLRLMRVAESAERTVEACLKNRGINLSQYLTLDCLIRRGPQPQTAIAKFLSRTGGNVSAVVAKLVNMGYVVRLESTEDQRMTIVKVTPGGEAFFESVHNEYRYSIDQYFSMLPSEVAAVVMQLTEDDDES